MRRILTALLALAALTAAPAGAQSLSGSLDAMVQARGDVVRTDNVTARLITDSVSVAPGSTFYFALTQDIREGWHTYWRNPGDSGEATSLTLNLPEGWAAGDLQWPAPRALPFGPLTNYGYKDSVVLPVAVSVPEDAPEGPLTIEASAYWLVCADICIPEAGEFAISLFVEDGAPRLNETNAALIADTLAGLPQAAMAEAALSLEAEGEARLSLADADLAEAQQAGALRNLRFFPYAPGFVEPSAKQTAYSVDSALLLSLTHGFTLADGAAPVSGVLAYETRADGDWRREAIEISATPAESLPGPEASGGFAFGALLIAMGGSFLGGIILNLMPCVFPVLSLKALSFAEKAHDGAGAVRRQGLYFLAGVMVTFLSIAIVLIALKGAGAAVGWGFQLQNPAVILALALLFFAIALNLLGFFELGGSLQNLGSGLAGRSGGAGAFFTGALAVIVATPCTAPFMAAALGYALTLPAVGALAVFAALGLGMAAPFTLLAFTPGLWSRLPKPGLWMDRFKQFMAFPMLGAAVWLLWVLSVQAGPTGVLTGLAAFLTLGFGVWLARLNGRAAKALAGIAVIAALISVPAAARLQAVSAPASGSGATADIDSRAWSPELQAVLIDEGRTVFVDFTAAWCVSCQVNDRVVLSRPDVKRAFNETGAVKLIADWTNRDAVIAAELEKFGRAGVPLYLVYRPGEDSPEILPQILTPGRVMEAIGA